MKELLTGIVIFLYGIATFFLMITGEASRLIKIHDIFGLLIIVGMFCPMIGLIFILRSQFEKEEIPDNILDFKKKD